MSEVCRTLNAFVFTTAPDDRDGRDGSYEVTAGSPAFDFWASSKAVSEILDKFLREFDGLGFAGHLYGYDMQVVERNHADVTVFCLPDRAGAGLLLDAMPVAVFRIDPYGRLLYVNPSVETLTGYSPSDLQDRGWTQVISEHTFTLIKKATKKSTATPEGFSCTFRILTPLGARRSLSVNATALFSHDGHVTSYLIVVTDVSERAEMDDRFKWLARHDSLTGLLNRGATVRQISNVIAEGQHLESALLYIDLDGFKQVNDTYGHDHGDEILRVSARRMTRAVRSHDMVGRVGGDEFVVVGRNLADENAALAMAEKISTIMSAPIAVTGQVHSLRGSVGIALGRDLPEPTSPFTDDLAAQWIKRADTAMYMVKRSDDSKQSVRVHNDQLETDQRRLEGQKAELVSFIADGKVDTVFQPIMDCDGSIRAFEALARPDELEAHADISELMATALREGGFPEFFERLSETCLTDISIFIDALPQLTSGIIFEKLRFNINADVQQLLSSGSAEDLLARLQGMGIENQRVILEVTEPTFDRHARLIHEQAKVLRSKGVGLSIGDFGLGQSPVRRIVDYGFTQVKIDKSYVHAVPEGNKAAVGLIKAVIAMSDAMGLELVAQGVETKEQYDCMRDLGVRLFQGFYLCEPLPWAVLVERYGRVG
ncbi:MAG: EAL domain-containing protein [Congregibacter sp.]